MIRWPATLPQSPERPGYKESRQDTSIRSSMAAGPPKSRRRFTAGTTDLSMVFIMSSSQLDILEAFWDAAHAGADVFLFPHPRTQVDAPVLASVYSVSPYGHDWKISMTFQVQPQ